MNDQSQTLLKRVDNQARGPYREAAYSELGLKHNHQIDVIEQLRSNLDLLEDLHGRMKFMMNELSSLVKKTKSF